MSAHAVLNSRYSEIYDDNGKPVVRVQTVGVGRAERQLSAVLVTILDRATTGADYESVTLTADEARALAGSMRLAGTSLADALHLSAEQCRDDDARRAVMADW